MTKGGLNSEIFSLWLQSPKNVPKTMLSIFSLGGQSSKQFLAHFLGDWINLKNFLRLSHLKMSMHSQPNKAPFFCCCPCPPEGNLPKRIFTCFAFPTKVNYGKRQSFTMQNQKKLFRPLGLEAKVEDGGFLFLKMRKTKENIFFPTFFS